MEYGLQLYSVRDATEKDLRGTLESVAALGYKMVEFAGFFGHSGQEVAGWLKELGLRASGTHTSLEALDQDFQGVVDCHHAIGCDRLIVPAVNVQARGGYDALVEQLADYQRRLGAEGIYLGYHNHSFEFAPDADGVTLWDTLVKRTTIPMENDTFWVYAAKQDPIYWMKTLHAQNRLPVIHIKDGFADGEGKPLGMGTAPVRDVYHTARELNVPMVVESETLTPSGLEEARVCIEYLRLLERE